MADIRPPFTSAAAATAKVKAAQALWNGRDPARVARAYTPDSVWRNRDVFIRGTAEIEAFLAAKWARERGYRLRKELFAFGDDRIAVQFWYEYYRYEGEDGGNDTGGNDTGGNDTGGNDTGGNDTGGNDTDGRQTDGGQADGNPGDGGGQREDTRRRLWRRAYGLEDWTFAADGRMRKRQMSANEVAIGEGERWFGAGVTDVDAVEIGEEHW